MKGILFSIKSFRNSFNCSSDKTELLAAQHPPASLLYPFPVPQKDSSFFIQYFSLSLTSSILSVYKISNTDISKFFSPYCRIF